MRVGKNLGIVCMQERLIPVLQEKVKCFLWGGVEDWKRKLDIVTHLPPRPLDCLRDIRYFTPSGKRMRYILSEPMDCTFCRHCGQEVAWWQWSCAFCSQSS